MGVRPIQSKTMQKVCTLSGLQGKMFGEHLIQLRDIEKSLIVSIQKVEQAEKDEALWGNLVVTAKLVKLGCDVAISAMSMVPGAGMGATAVSMIYDRATLVSDVVAAPQNAGSTVAQALGEAHIDGLSRSLEYLGKDKAGKLIDASKALVRAQIALDDAITTAKANKTSGSGITSAKRSVLMQLGKIRARMAMLEKQLADCGMA